MAKTVFVFGAGASVTSGTPLMKGFIDSADDLRSDPTSGVSHEDFGLFFDVLQNRLPQLHSKSVVELGNIESVFGIVEMARLAGRLPLTDPGEIERVSSATRRVLADTIELRCRFKRGLDKWMPPRDYLSIVGWIERERLAQQAGEVALVSFNYDVALDFALHFSLVPADYCLGDQQHATVPLLKLHGSLNWSLCRKCKTITPISLGRIFQMEPKGDLRDDASTAAILATRCLTANGAHCPESPATNDPGIVPPSWNKTQYHESFSRVWQRAAREIAEAREIYVIGYSFPPSDAFFRDLLALGLFGSTRLKRFEVVDPDATVAGRFRELLGPESKNRFVHAQTEFLPWTLSKYRDSGRWK